MMMNAMIDAVRDCVAPWSAANTRAGASVHGIERRDWPSLLRALVPCGSVQVCTRGHFAALEATSRVGHCTGTEATLDASTRRALAQWRAIFAVRAATGGAAAAQLRIVGKQGRLLHRVSMHSQTFAPDWRALLQRFAAPAAAAPAPRGLDPAMGGRKPAAEVAPTSPQSNALPQPGAGCLARELKTEAVIMALFAANEDGLILRPSVAGSGWVQPPRGPVHRIRAAPHGAGRWLQASGPAFDLCWCPSAMARIWAVRLATRARISHRIVALGAGGELILALEGGDGGGRRGPWSELIWSLPRRRARVARPQALLRSLCAAGAY